jgi:hypothetical protein
MALVAGTDATPGGEPSEAVLQRRGDTILIGRLAKIAQAPSFPLNVLGSDQADQGEYSGQKAFLHR